MDHEGCFIDPPVLYATSQGHDNPWVVLYQTLMVARGEMVALVAPSGAGKSTLLHIAGLLDTPDAGTVAIEGEAMAGLGDRRRTELRRRKIGFVYQFHHLLPEFSGAENIVLPQFANGIGCSAAEGDALLLANEPTGNLDPATSDRVFGALIELVRGTELSALIATHNLELAARMDRLVRLEAGRVVA